MYNIKNKWIPEIGAHRPETPIILCGTQLDLRADSATIAALAKIGRTPVSPEQALAICCEVEAVNYVETSSKDAMNERDIHEAFELCALAAIKHGKLGMMKRSPSTSSSQKNILHNVSLGSDVAGSHKRLFQPNGGSGSSSLKKAPAAGCNVSFSGSESEVHHLSSGHNVPPIQEDEDDVFPGGSSETSCVPPLSPRLGGLFDHRRKAHRSSMGCLTSTSSSSIPHNNNNNNINGSNNSVVLRNEFADGVTYTSTAKSPRSSGLVETVLVQSPPPQAQAQVRSNGLSRRTSFRSQANRGGTVAQAIPVSSPKSPLGSVSSYDLKSPTNAESCRSGSSLAAGAIVLPSGITVPVFDVKPGGQSGATGQPGQKVVGFESLKSHTSTGSQGSTGSKTSTSSSVVSSKSAGILQSSSKVIGGSSPNILDPSVPDTEDPKLLSQLQFVSPKTGVFRPVNSASSNAAAAGLSSSIGKAGGGKKKQNCSVM